MMLPEEDMSNTGAGYLGLYTDTGGVCGSERSLGISLGKATSGNNLKYI